MNAHCGHHVHQYQGDADRCEIERLRSDSEDQLDKISKLVHLWKRGGAIGAQAANHLFSAQNGILRDVQLLKKLVREGQHRHSRSGGLGRAPGARQMRRCAAIDHEVPDA